MDDQRRRAAVRIAIGAVLASLFFVALIVWVLSDEDDEDTRAIAADQQNAVAEVAKNPARYYERELTLRGRVRDVLGPRVVAIGPPRRGRRWPPAGAR